MTTVLPNERQPAALTGTNFGWGPDSYATGYGTSDFANSGFSTPLGVTDGKSSFTFANAMSAFTNQEPADQGPNLPVTTVDPMNMWSGPDPCTSPSTASRQDSAYSSSGTPKTSETGATEMTAYSTSATPRIPDTGGFETTAYSIPEKSQAAAKPPSPEIPLEGPTPIQTESHSTSRARHAANQRHRKARNLKQASNSNSNSITNPTATTSTPTKPDQKKALLREKNKVAAAKCRQRQRKQAETIRAKGGRLSETNAQLKSYVQELRQELNSLRALALGHGECDARLATYNKVQAERVMREYYDACGGHGEQQQRSKSR